MSSIHYFSSIHSHSSLSLVVVDTGESVRAGAGGESKEGKGAEKIPLDSETTTTFTH